MLQNVQHQVPFSEKYTESRLQAQLCSYAQCMLVRHGNPVEQHRITNDALHHP